MKSFVLAALFGLISARSPFENEMQGIVDQIKAHPEETPVMMGNATTYTTPTESLKDMVKAMKAAGKKIMPLHEKLQEESKENTDTLKMKLQQGMVERKQVNKLWVSAAKNAKNHVEYSNTAGWGKIELTDPQNVVSKFVKANVAHKKLDMKFKKAWVQYIVAQKKDHKAYKMAVKKSNPSREKKNCQRHPRYHC